MGKKKSKKKENQEWITSGNPGEFPKPNDGWETKNTNEFISSGNASWKTGNPLIDNAGLW